MDNLKQYIAFRRQERAKAMQPLDATRLPLTSDQILYIAGLMIAAKTGLSLNDREINHEVSSLGLPGRNAAQKLRDIAERSKVDIDLVCLEAIKKYWPNLSAAVQNGYLTACSDRPTGNFAMIDNQFPVNPTRIPLPENTQRVTVMVLNGISGGLYIICRDAFEAEEELGGKISLLTDANGQIRFTKLFPRRKN